jgi:hypothetical protein
LDNKSESNEQKTASSERVHWQILGKAASVSNDTSGLKATDIFPLNPNAIPDNFFYITDNSVTPRPATEPQPSTSASDRTVYLEPSSSSLTAGLDENTPSKYLLEINGAPEILIPLNKRVGAG